MWIWNLAHNTVGLHVYELLAVILMAAVVTAAAVHLIRLKKKNVSTEKKISGDEKGTEEAENE